MSFRTSNESGDGFTEPSGAKSVADGLAEDVDDADSGPSPGAQNVRDEEVDSSGLDVAPLADPNGREDSHQDEGHGQSQGVNGQLEQGRENDGSDPRAGRTDTDCNAKIPENKA